MNSRPPRKTKTIRERRKRAPISSVVVFALLIICAIFLGIKYFTGEERKTENNNTPPVVTTKEQTNETPAVTEESPVIIIPTETEPTPAQKVPAVQVRGFYLDAWTAAAPGSIDTYINICDNSEMNAVVIDVKEDSGYITYIMDNDSVAPACVNVMPNVRELVSRLKEHGIYTIARVVCFKDPIWAKIHPEAAIQTRWGDVWADAGGVAWLDPYKTSAWDYVVTVAKEVAKAGFDEVQLDYVRFPADGALGDIDYGSIAEEKKKAEAIGEFIEYVKKELESTPVRLSADVFGIIAVSKGDFEGIGQDLDVLLRDSDAISPMIYPSHFANKKQNGVGQIINDVLFEKPDLEPYGVVYNILVMVKNRLPKGEEHAIIRPFIQAFTASYLGSGYYIPYTAQEVYDQIRAVYDAGFDEWLLWNHSGDYSIYGKLATLLNQVKAEQATPDQDTPATPN